jgi:hypothetical protein
MPADNNHVAAVEQQRTGNRCPDNANHLDYSTGCSEREKSGAGKIGEMKLQAESILLPWFSRLP